MTLQNQQLHVKSNIYKSFNIGYYPASLNRIFIIFHVCIKHIIAKL